MKSGWRIIALMSCLAVAAPVVAQAESTAYAEAHSRGTAAFNAGRFEEAAQHFKEAFAAEPRGNLLYNIGLCYEKVGRVEDAVAYYQRFVDALPNSPKRPAVQRKITELKQQLSDRYVEVSVATSPPGAVIFVDDKSKGAMGAAPVTFKLLPGKYAIIAEMPGHEAATQRIELQEGAPAMVDLVLIGSDQVGTVNLLISERDADVMLDGRRIGRSPLPDSVRMRAGGHDLLVMKPGFATFKKKIDVQPGVEQRIDVQLSGEAVGDLGGGGGGGGGSIWPWVTVGVGVAAVGAGVFTGLSAQNLHDQLDDKRKKGELIAPADIDTGNNLVLMTNVLMGVGVAAIAGGVTWWFLDDGVSSSGQVQAGFMPTDGGAAVQLQGAF